MASFEAVADEYDAGRPSYPDEVFDALGPIDGLRVLDVGAGTGIATRALIARRADGQRWFDDYWGAIERCCPGTHRGQRDTDWGATVAASGVFDTSERVTVPWVREIPVEMWMVDQTSHSYVIGLRDVERGRLLADLRQIVHAEFTDGTMKVRYETWLWTATRI